MYVSRVPWPVPVPGLRVLPGVFDSDFDSKVQRGFVSAGYGGPQSDITRTSVVAARIPSKDCLSNHAQLQTRVQLSTRHSIDVTTESNTIVTVAAATTNIIIVPHR